MPSSSGLPRRVKAGSTIRQLAIRRRLKALATWGAAVNVLALPFLAQWLPQLFAPHSPIVLPIYAYGILVIVAGVLVWQGMQMWQQANRADQGAKGEEEIAHDLQTLVTEGWDFEFGRMLGRGLGDADIIAISPRSQVYVIDVKSHRTQVTTDGQILWRRRGQSSTPFEKNFIERSRRQALRVKALKQVKWVTPLLVFSAGSVNVPTGSLQGVYVVDRSGLIPLLQRLG